MGKRELSVVVSIWALARLIDSEIDIRDALVRQNAAVASRQRGRDPPGLGGKPPRVIVIVIISSARTQWRAVRFAGQVNCDLEDIAIIKDDCCHGLGAVQASRLRNLISLELLSGKIAIRS